MNLPRRRAFTLVELLVVITILVVLAGLLMPALSYAQFVAKATVTRQRMTAILTAVAAYGNEDSSRCLALQQHLDLGGTGRFASVDAIRSIVLAGGAGRSQPPDLIEATGRRDVLTGRNFDHQSQHRHTMRRMTFDAVPPESGPVAATWYHQVWPPRWPESGWDQDPPVATPPILRFPWGHSGLRRDGLPADPRRPATDVIVNLGYPATNAWVSYGNAAPDAQIWRYQVTDTTRTSPVVNGYEARRSDGTVLPGVQGNVPMPFDVGWMSPLRTISFLQAADILPPGPDGAEAFRTDRLPTRAWNDRWGRPLIAVYALFIPERVHSTDNGDYTTNARDRLLKMSLEHYRYNRALYLSVAAAGPAALTAPTTWTAAEDAVALRDLWQEIRTRTRAVDWQENSFADPPWEGIREHRPMGRMSAAYLSVPMEIK